MTATIGQLAALGTALMFAFGSTLFTISGRTLGSPLVNRTRLLLAVLVITLVHWVTTGQPIPADAGSGPWFWLGVSGLVGLALGDAALFQAFVMIGPRLSMLMMALAPVLAAVMAWMFLGESLNLQEIIGIVVTVGGIAFVVAERQGKQKNKAIQAETPREYAIGLLFAFGGAVGQAGGSVLSKAGLENDFSPLSATLIRLIIALIAIWLFTALRGEVRSSFTTLRRHPRAVGWLSLATLVGPVIGVWLSLVAIQQTDVGIASTLIALTPVFLLPIGYIVFQERVSRQAVIGTVVAFAGTALFFL